MHAIVTYILIFVHNYNQGGREMTFIPNTQLETHLAQKDAGGADGCARKTETPAHL